MVARTFLPTLVHVVVLWSRGRPVGVSTAPCANLDAQTVHWLLATERRLAICVAVAEADRPLSAGALGTLLASRERRAGPGQVDEATAERICEDLRTDHLPALVTLEVLARAPPGYESGPNLPGVLAVADATNEHLC